LKVIPAVDLMGGRVVRLFQGNPNEAKYYDNLGDPVAVAKKWEEEGADALHVVDLDAAFDRGNNLETILRIIKEIRLPVQVGGGIRSLEVAEKLFESGAGHVILGTISFKKPEILRFLAEKYGGRVIVALDHINGEVMVEGWRKSTGFKLEDAIKIFLEINVHNFLVTSIRKDGTLQGIDLKTLKEASKIKEAKIIAAGGVGSLKDLAALKEIGVYGVVVGKALYEGAFKLSEALKIARG